MNPLILEQNAKKWVDSCRYLKGMMNDMRPEEVTALDFLMEAWRTRPYDDELKREASEMCEILKDSDQYHGNNREIINHSKQIRSISNTLYMKDAATFKEMSDALRKALNEAKPKTTPKPRPTPKTNPTPNPKPKPTPKRNPGDPSIRITKVEFQAQDFDGHLQYPSEPWVIYPNVKYLTPRVSFEILDPDKSVTLRVRIYRPDGTLLRADTSNSYTYENTFSVRNGSDSVWLSGWGNNVGNLYGEGRFKFEIWEGTNLLEISYINIKRKPTTGPGFRIKKLYFVNTNVNGTIIDQLGENWFSTSALYIQPVIEYEGGPSAGTVEFGYRYYYPNGTMMTGTCSRNGCTNFGTVNLGDSGEAYLGGYGSDSGKAYQTPGTYRVEIVARGTVVAKGEFRIGNTGETFNIEDLWERVREQNKPNMWNSETSSDYFSIPTSTTKKKWIKPVLISAGVLLVMIWILTRVAAYNRDQSAPVMYTPAATLFENDHKTPIQSIRAGEPLKVYDTKGEWAEVKTSDGKKGTVARSTLLSEAEYNTLQNVIDNNPIIKQNQLDAIVQDMLTHFPEAARNGARLKSIKEGLTPVSVVYRTEQQKDEFGNNYKILGMVLSSENKNWFGLYKIGHTFKELFFEEIKPGLLISDIIYDPRKDGYKVNYMSDRNIVSPKKAEKGTENVFAITNVSFVNTNRYGQTINRFINHKTLYACPEITYRGAKPWDDVHLTVKIYSPYGLEQDAKSPVGATYKCDFTPTSSSGKMILRGYGNSEGDFWKYNEYTFEFWQNGEMIASKTVKL